jgi:hypothetical protein
LNHQARKACTELVEVTAKKIKELCALSALRGSLLQDQKLYRDFAKALPTFAPRNDDVFIL